MISECTKSYGENCKFQCSIQCINETCDRFNGRYLIDCKGGKECDMGWFFIFLMLKFLVHILKIRWWYMSCLQRMCVFFPIALTMGQESHSTLDKKYPVRSIGGLLFIHHINCNTWSKCILTLLQINLIWNFYHMGEIKRIF